MPLKDLMFDGYKPSHINLNSPEINKLAYSPAMNRHIDQIKAGCAQKARDALSGSKDIGLEAADHIRFKAKGTVSRTFSNPLMREAKPKFCCLCKERVYTSYIVNGAIYGECCKRKRIEQA